jgi:hypothetical protein
MASSGQYGPATNTAKQTGSCPKIGCLPSTKSWFPIFEWWLPGPRCEHPFLSSLLASSPLPEQEASAVHDPMTILKADHREARKMLTALADSDEGAERQKTVEEIDQALRLHMQIEEHLVYPLIKSELGAEDEEEAEVEHGLARDRLRR